jgi:hypothetical protein
MKKLILVVLAVSLGSAPAHADPYAGVSLKGGIAGAKFNRPHRHNRYDTTGGAAGHLGWQLTGRFSLAGQLELLYTPRGTQVTFYYPPPSANSLHRYFDVAITARPEVRLGPGSLYLLLGASRNHLISADVWRATTGHSEVTHLVRETDVALRAGIGAVWPLPRHTPSAFHRLSVFLEASHDRGMIDLDLYGLGVRNRTSSVMAGLTFRLTAR